MASDPRFAARRALLALFAPAVVVAAPRAQHVTVPASMAGVEGGGGTNIPFGSNLACRYQCIYDATELPWTGPRIVTGVRLRPDHLPNVAVPAKGFLEISVLMSTTSRSSTDASATFADNYGVDHTWVVQNQLIQLPAQPAVATGPLPANIVFVFQAPWAHGLVPATSTLPPPGNLLIEIWIHSQPSGSYRVDNLSSCTAPVATFGLVGPACAVPGQPPVTLTSGASMLAGSSYSWHVANGTPSMPFVVALNTTNHGGLFGNPAWPLPYPMFDPQNPAAPSPALAALGWPAPDCYLNITPAATLAGICDASGAGTASAVLPPGPQLVGQDFHAQALALAPAANPLRIVTSLGRTTTVCGPLGVARVHAFYNGTGNPPPPATGTVQRGVGLILEVF